MKRRFIVITDREFPKSGALSNYIENIIKIIREQFKGASIIAVSKNNPGETIDIDGVASYSFGKDMSTNSFTRCVRRVFSTIVPCETDVVFDFISKAEHQMWFFFNYKYRNNVICFFGEYFDRHYFQDSIIGSLLFLRYRMGLWIERKYSHALVISDYLKEKLDIQYTICIPALYDSEKCIYKSKKRLNNKFIYPGGDWKKDRIDRIIEAFCMIDDEDREGLELHFTGVSQTKIERIVADKSKIEVLEGNLKVHDWLNEHDYYDLLAQMDFVIIIKDDNQVSRANFPTKIPELMSFGVIPIVSDVGDYTRCYLRDGIDSFVIEGSHAESFSKMIVKVAKMDDAQVQLIRERTKVTARREFGLLKWGRLLKSFVEQTI